MTQGIIPAEPRHVQKLITPGPELVLTGGHFKWYDIHRADTAIAPEVGAQARAFLQAQQLTLHDDLGFVVLHKSGGVHFLIVCAWRNDNEMWQALYFKEDGEFALYPRSDDPFTPTQCVWELGATAHERQAWSRYLVSAQDAAAREAYLADRFSGLV